MLLALGLFDEGSPMVLRYFPVAQPELAFTGSLVLARAGDTKRSLYIAEILSKRVPASLPVPLLPVAFRQLLFPATYHHLIRREAGRREIDPHLLAAIIREESRFDPQAFSAASARGLTQFVFPTAREVAARNELGSVTPRDLEEPEVAIALGAAYLSQLYDDLGGSVAEVVAAYNAASRAVAALLSERRRGRIPHQGGVSRDAQLSRQGALQPGELRRALSAAGGRRLKFHRAGRKPSSDDEGRVDTRVDPYTPW